jgi:cbb3-type cytochrome oxidase subunit 3
VIREAFAHSNPLAVLALVGFLALFAAIIAYVATDRRKGHHQRMQHLPLEDDRHE